MVDIEERAMVLLNALSDHLLDTVYFDVIFEFDHRGEAAVKLLLRFGVNLRVRVQSRICVGDIDFHVVRVRVFVEYSHFWDKLRHRIVEAEEQLFRDALEELPQLS